jgi:hypothetical protein
VDKLKAFPKENQEKKQLEEIAHLYFSTPAPPSEVPKERERSFGAFSPVPRALFVHCASGRPEGGMSTWFLFNLAVMLKILNGPVLLIGSQHAYEKRFLFGFRPDRERLRVEDGPQISSGSFGPMGLCLLDGRVLWRGLKDERDVYPVDPLAGGQVGFRYILSDEAPSGGVFRSLPSLVLLLVTPTTTTPALLESAMGTEDDLFPGHAGIVVAGAGCTEEADALYLYWRDRLRERCDRELAVENWGRLHWDERGPLDAPLSDLETSGVGVLEAPESARARFCQTAASLIRKKRLEWGHGVA